MTQPPYCPPPSEGPSHGQLLAAPPAFIPTEHRGRNVFAIWSFWLGLLGPILGGALVGLVLGIIAVVQVGKTGQRGKGLAIAGIALSSLWILAVAGLVAYGLTLGGSSGATPKGPLAEGGSFSRETFEPGQCINELQGGDTPDYPPVPCTGVHDGEVFGIFLLDQKTWPGKPQVDSMAGKLCADRLVAYSPRANDDPAFHVLYQRPNKDSWDLGDRRVTCIVTDPSKEHTGSVKDG